MSQINGEDDSSKILLDKNTEDQIQGVLNKIFIISSGAKKGMGYFSKIVYNKWIILPILICNCDIIDKEEISQNKAINISINNNNKKIIISVDNSRKVYINNKQYKIAIFEIKQSD